MNTQSRILVIDDDPVLRQATANMLASDGYGVLEAATGHEGLRLVHEHRPDLVLLSSVLANLDGLEVRRRIKADPETARIYVAVLSGSKIGPDSQADELEASADDTIVRPIARREFLARVRAMLRIRAAEAALCESEARFRLMSGSERNGRRQLESLYRISQTLNSTLDADAVFDRLTDEAMRATHASHGSVLVVRHEREIFERRSLRGYSPEQVQRARTLPLSLNQGANGRAYRTQRPVYMADVSQQPDYFALIPETHSELVVPITRSGQAIGNLDLQSHEVDAFKSVDLDFLQVLTDQVAVALENARLFEETRRQMDELAIVSQVALVGAAGRPFDETVAHATQALARLWPDTAQGFAFLDEATQLLQLHPSYQGLADRTDCIPLDHGIAGWAVRERRPIRLGNVQADPRYIGCDRHIQSEMVAPLLVGDHVLGVIHVESPLPDAFSGDDLRLLTTLAGQFAIILEKARLDAELAQHAALLELRVEERTAEIHRQQVRTLAILDALGEGVVVTDIAGTVQYVNPAMEGLTGYTAAKAIGQNPRLWKSAETPPDLYRELWNTILAGRTWRGEVSNRREDGTLYDAALTVAPISGNGDGSKIAGFVGVQRDITERKRAEGEIRKALTQEKELGDLKSRFISMTSHEFRTPLSTILSSSELIEHYGTQWSEEKRFVHLRRIQSAVQNMTRLLDGVLFIGRAEAGKVEFDPGPLDLAQFCRDLAEEMQLGAGRQHTIESVILSEHQNVYMDEKLLRQILDNLLSNAVKYSPPGSTVRFQVRCEDGQATFTIHDQGIGIPSEDQGRLFEAFHRARNVGNVPGTGLGLTIVKKSVDLHRGTFGFISQVNAGTTFVVTLPTGCSRRPF